MLPLLYRKLEIMAESKGKYTKEPVKIRLKDKADGRKSIYLEIYLDGKRTYERIPDLFIIEEKSETETKKNRATLNKVEKLRKQRIREIQKNAVPNKYVETVEDKTVLLFDWMDEYYTIQKNRGLRQLVVVARAKRFLTLYSKDIPLNKIDKAFCIGFSNFLKTGYKMSNGACLSPKSGFNILGEVSTAMNTAVRNGIIKSNPFTQLTPSEKIQPVEAVREYLTIDEVKELIKTPCEEPLVKQAYLFSCNCGLRLSDVLNLRWKDLLFTDGSWKVGTRMIKTDRVVFIPLPQQALRWLPQTKRIPEEKVFSGLNRSLIAKCLKPWAKEAGIKNKNVTFHTSRHTYATMLLTLGVDLYTVSKLLGHTNIKHTQRYAKIINQKKDEAVGMLDKL